jgi:hypothetical protein
VLSIPWTIRNYVVHRALVPISVKASRYTDPVTNLFQARPAPVVPEVPAAADAPGIAHNTIEYWRCARFRESPGNPAIGVRPEPAWSLRHNVVMVLNFGILLPFFAAGIVIAGRRRRRAPLVLTGIVVSHAILRAFLGGSEEARLPVEPLIILLAFYGLRELLEMRRAAGAGAGG